MRVRVDTVVDTVAVVRVEEDCCSPWHMYCNEESAAPALPSPKKIAEFANAHENSSLTGTVTPTVSPEATMLSFAAPKHATESLTSS